MATKNSNSVSSIEVKSLSRRFGIKHIMKLITESARFSAEEEKYVYLNYNFLTKRSEDNFEIYSFTINSRIVEVKRSLKNGVLYIKGVFGSFKASDIENVILRAIRFNI